jgi:type IV pilus assembly protein PilA
MLIRKNEKGFTLIELMIVIAIIGILAAIAIPQFNAYRARSYNAAALSDLRNVITGLEGYYVDWDLYPSGDAATLLADYGYSATSDGVTIGAITGGAATYSIADTYNSKAASRAITYTVAADPGGQITEAMP